MESEAEKLLSDLLDNFIMMDECHVSGDHNNVLKKIHEGISKIKQHKQGASNE